MKFSKTQFIIGASFLALLVLILCQFLWLRQSKRLLEEQFDQKVTMALCQALNDLSEGRGCGTQCEAIITDIQNCCVGQKETALGLSNLKKELTSTLARYDIKMDYNLSVVNKDSFDEEDAPAYTCSLSPIIPDDSHLLSINFPDKVDYLMQKLGFMMGSSIFILLFICLVFLLANYALHRQKKISEMNVDFFNNMAHEFKTPLTNISLATNLLAKNNESARDNRFIGVIKKENQKLKEQVDRVLHMANLESGEARLQLERLDPGEVIRSVITDSKFTLEEMNAKVTLNLEEGIRVNADRFHLANAFRNILDNSLKYCDREPEINISLYSRENKAIVHFEDNGIGISQSNQKYIFNKFQRLPTGNIHNQKGFGLGLSYVKRVMKLHKGGINVKSELNKGSKFELVLPTQTY